MQKLVEGEDQEDAAAQRNGHQQALWWLSGGIAGASLCAAGFGVLRAGGSLLGPLLLFLGQCLVTSCILWFVVRSALAGVLQERGDRPLK